MTTLKTSMVTALVRYGAISEVIRCSGDADSQFRRGETVVVRTPRGEELGTLLEVLKPPEEPGTEPPEVSGEILRRADATDRQQAANLAEISRKDFAAWVDRISDWGLDLQLIDMEFTLDQSRTILYVLNERGPESTKLALQAAAAGLGVIDVQPVDANGLVTVNSGGGCGSCGCH